MTVAWGVLMAAGVVAGLALVVRFASTLGAHCRCGHARSVHRGRHTECFGVWQAERNAIGVRQWASCPCQSYRRTELRYWQRIVHGTEESPDRRMKV